MTKVIFRKKYRGDEKAYEVVAFFPECHVNPGNIMSYAHDGQHCEASYLFYISTKPCTPAEYADLKRELETCCDYDDLKVVRKVTRRDQERAWWPERFSEDDGSR